MLLSDGLLLLQKVYLVKKNKGGMAKASEIGTST